MSEAAERFDFPPRSDAAPAPDRALARRGVGLRRATPDDAGFLFDLYASFRAEEMAAAPWPEAARTAFLQSQFSLQHRHFTTAYPAADFLVVEIAGLPAGRLYVDWRPPEALIIDIGLSPENRGSGVGGMLLDWVADEARTRGCERVGLSVLIANPRARALYERRGFKGGMIQGAHLRMARALRA